jgi:hypothetical protein
LSPTIYENDTSTLRKQQACQNQSIREGIRNQIRTSRYSDGGRLANRQPALTSNILRLPLRLFQSVLSDKPPKNHWIGRLLLPAYFVVIALLNLFILIQANQLAFSQSQQPYDFYVLLHASSQIFSAPTRLYVHQDPNTFGSYWSRWLWDGASYLYTPMFALFLVPFSSLPPPIAKTIWVGFSYVLLVVACGAILKVITSTKLRFLLPIMIFIMPFQILYTDQTLPQFWLPQMPAMWLSPVFFTDYYWGNTNTAILSLGLLSYYFAVRSEPINLRISRIPSYVFSSLFLALDSFKITSFFLIFPFWIAFNRKKAWKSLGFLVLFLLIVNSVAIFEPTLLIGYLYAVRTESTAALWQVYEYVWYYSLPLVGVALLLSERKVHRRNFMEIEPRDNHSGKLESEHSH